MLCTAEHPLETHDLTEMGIKGVTFRGELNAEDRAASHMLHLIRISKA